MAKKVREEKKSTTTGVEPAIFRSNFVTSTPHNGETRAICSRGVKGEDERDRLSCRKSSKTSNVSTWTIHVC